MNEKVNLILTVFIKLLKMYGLGLEIYESGSMVFVDLETGERGVISQENLKKLYEDMEAKE